MKSNLHLIYFLLLSAVGFSQGFDVGGTVKESDTGLPIPDANVSVMGSTLGTNSDIDGKFSLKNVPAGSVLSISYIGYKSATYKVTSSNTSIVIKLITDTKGLDEVVVIGYGSQKRKDVTGAVGIVSNKTIEQLKPIRIEQTLQGTLAGVTATANSGSPGSDFAILIRGVKSNRSNEPLVIIDGNNVQLTDFNALNPNDIENVTILKDAQAAIYGTRGANGVILVSMKKGIKNSKARFSYSGYTGFQETSKKLNLLNATEYALLLNESYANGGQPVPYPSVGGLGTGTDWQREVFGSAVPVFNHDLSVSGGSEKITYAVGGSHLYQQGIVGGDKADFRRSSAHLAFAADLTDKLKLQSNIFYTYSNRDALNENGLGSVLFNAINAHPTMPIRDANGNYSLIPSETGYGNETINPLAQIENTYNDFTGRTLIGNFQLDYNLLKGLDFTSRIGFKSWDGSSKTFAKQVDYGSGKVFNNGRSYVSENTQNTKSYTLDLFLTYKRTLAEMHNFTFLLGTTSNKEWGKGLYATAFDVPNNSWEYADINLARGTSTSRDVGSYTTDERLNSYFARLQYDFKGKYLISAIIRRDSSTRFGTDNAVAYFPTILGGWVVSEENFLKDSETLNFLKFRASYGVLGNDKIGDNQYVGLLNGEAEYVFDNTLTSGRALGTLPNTGLKWEEARKFDVGLDAKFFNNHIDFTTDFFIEKRYNLLIEALPVSGITGVGAPGGAAPTQNAGAMVNKGLELALGYTAKIGDDFSIAANINYTTIHNEVTEVRSPNKYLQSGSFGVGQQPIARMEEGYTMSYFYGWQTDGIFQTQDEVDAHPSQVALGAPAQPGDIRYKDINGDGKIDLNDRTKVGNPLPDFTMGFNLNLNYKDFDFVLYSYASVGNDMVRNYERSVPNVNRMAYTLDRWTGPGTSNEVPRVTTAASGNNVFSDYFVEDASYLRIQNVQLGFSLPADVIKRVNISKARIYAGVNNPYTFTKYRGYDPAGGSTSAIGLGIDYGYYPVARTYLLGVNLNF
ncbi:MAG TPA: TonB-dependent receptor [Flavobacterium sp.]|nr:TonB-dependent receptor [Flavobacterium sp.]HPJ09495.1 TonB-dependent receptor [Flavobacterium sp.]